MNHESHTVEQAIVSRQSVRGFLPKPVSKALIRHILSVSARAPSGSNIQPWQVHVVTGTRRDALSKALLDAHYNNEPERREYQYYPVEWRDPYLARRRETGWGLYHLLGIPKGDRAASAQQNARNYEFFDAPCVLFFTIDNDLDKGSWLDYGMFLQNIMIMARSCGLDTCAQAALANYPDIVKAHLGISEQQIVMCGMSIGYQNTDVLANQYRTTRVSVDTFTHFHEG